ncbi:Tfp pilus assembly protein, ATPase PilM [Lachnospiraceae bacterium JC7]|nr:Tfp pilus assembly protein, ATPase PilM [Lachnospiraceae bacterium JC7]
MKNAKVVGIDIGDYRIKVSYIVKGKITEFFYENVPDNAVRGGMIQFWDAMAEFLRDTFKAHKIRCRNVIFSVPVSGVYVRTVELPVMTVKQLDLNLPFEFHDYISDNTDKYFYDYAVIERSDKNMKLLAVACSKELIERYRTLAKNARLNAVGLVPDVIGIQRILIRYNQLYSVQRDKDYAILDMGDQSFKIHFYNHGVYDVTRSLEPGGYSFAETISSITGTDVHIARISEEENVDDIQTHEKLVQLYESRAVEIMRALNFYSYSNTANTIDTLYYFGGSGNIRRLVQILSETLNIPVRPLSVLNGTKDESMRDIFNLSPHSYGITLDPDEEAEPLSEEEISDISRCHESYDTAEKEDVEKKNVDTETLAGSGDSGEDALKSGGSAVNGADKPAEAEGRDGSAKKESGDEEKLHRLEDRDEILVRLDDSEPEDRNRKEDISSKEENIEKETKAVQESTLKSIEELTEQLSRGNVGEL